MDVLDILDRLVGFPSVAGKPNHDIVGWIGTHLTEIARKIAGVSFRSARGGSSPRCGLPHKYTAKSNTYMSLLAGPEGVLKSLILLSFSWAKIRNLPVSFRMVP